MGTYYWEIFPKNMYTIMIAHWQQVYGLPRQQAYAGIESLR